MHDGTVNKSQHHSMDLAQKAVSKHARFFRVTYRSRMKKKKETY